MLILSQTRNLDSNMENCDPNKCTLEYQISVPVRLFILDNFTPQYALIWYRYDYWFLTSNRGVKFNFSRRVLGRPLAYSIKNHQTNYWISFFVILSYRWFHFSFIELNVIHVILKKPEIFSAVTIILFRYDY